MSWTSCPRPCAAALDQARRARRVSCCTSCATQRGGSSDEVGPAAGAGAARARRRARAAEQVPGDPAVSEDPVHVAMHRTRVRVVEDALDANNTIARANRDDFDRHGVRRREPDERARARARRRCSSARSATAAAACASACSRATSQGSLDADRLSRAARAGHPAQHRRRASAASATSTRTWCARRCPTLPLDEHRPARDRERRQPRLPGRVPGRRGRRGRWSARSPRARTSRSSTRSCSAPASWCVVNKIDLLPHLDFDVDLLLANLECGQPGRRGTCS